MANQKVNYMCIPGKYDASIYCEYYQNKLIYLSVISVKVGIVIAK